jgi:aspartate 1-decarboxylase
MRSFLRSKIHRATVTQADLNYEGSLSIDQLLMEEAEIAPFEEVRVWNITRGTRLETYAIEAPRHSGIICANGAAAHLVNTGDLIIIATFHLVATAHEATPPIVLHVDESNRPLSKRAEIAGPDRANNPSRQKS